MIGLHSTHAHTQKRKRTRTHARTYIHTQTHTRTYICAYTGERAPKGVPQTIQQYQFGTQIPLRTSTPHSSHPTPTPATPRQGPTNEDMLSGRFMLPTLHKSGPKDIKVKEIGNAVQTRCSQGGVACMYVHTHTHTYTQTHACTHTHTHTHAHTHTPTHIHS